MCSNIKQKIREIININIDTQVQASQEIEDIADLGVNSVNFIKIVVALENEYGFEFADEDLSQIEKFRTISSLARYIEENI